VVLQSGQAPANERQPGVSSVVHWPLDASRKCQDRVRHGWLEEEPYLPEYRSENNPGKAPYLPASGSTTITVPEASAAATRGDPSPARKGSSDRTITSSVTTSVPPPVPPPCAPSVAPPVTPAVCVPSTVRCTHRYTRPTAVGGDEGQALVEVPRLCVVDVDPLVCPQGDAVSPGVMIMIHRQGVDEAGVGGGGVGGGEHAVHKAGCGVPHRAQGRLWCSTPRTPFPRRRQGSSPPAPTPGRGLSGRPCCGVMMMGVRGGNDGDIDGADHNDGRSMAHTEFLSPWKPAVEALEPFPGLGIKHRHLPPLPPDHQEWPRAPNPTDIHVRDIVPHALERPQKPIGSAVDDMHLARHASDDDAGESIPLWPRSRVRQQAVGERADTVLLGVKGSKIVTIEEGDEPLVLPDC
jgi:hypothetical protein